VLTWLAVVLRAVLPISLALVLLFLHQLRELSRRGRAGGPSDAGNTTRMRRVGVLPPASWVVFGTFEFWMSSWVVQTLERSSVPIHAPLDVDGSAVFIALVLIGLG